MNFEQLIRENMLRFGTKNLNENLKNYLMLEQTGSLDPDEIPVDELPRDVNPDYATLSYEKGQEFREKLKKVGATTKKVAITATIVAPLSKVIRDRLFKRYIRRKGIPTKEQLIAKDSNQVKSHPAYQQTVDLMYRDKRTLKAASTKQGQQAGLPVLYWYGVPALGGEANPDDQRAMQVMLDRFERNKNILSDGITDQTTKTEFDSNTTILYDGLKELYDNGIYITADDLLEATSSTSTQLNTVLSNLIYDSEIDPKDIFILTPQGLEVVRKFKNLVAAIKLGVADSGITPKGTKIQDLPLESTSTLTLNDDEKLEILTYYQRQSEYYRKPIINATFWDIEASSIGIKTNISLEKGNLKAGGNTVITYQYFTIPADPRGPEGKTIFFGNDDNATVVNSDGITQMLDFINDIIAEAKSNGQQVVSVNYCAGSKTSTVGTTYGMSAKKAAAAGESEKTLANETLAAARCKSILNAINKSVLPTIQSQTDMGTDKVNYDKISTVTDPTIVNGSFVHANAGPGWYEYDLIGSNDIFKGQGYGPLYTNLYQLLKTNKPRINGVDLFSYYSIPRYFYICRSQKDPEPLKRLTNLLTALKNSDPKKYSSITIPTQQQIEAEYQNVFGPFRGSFAGFMIGTVKSTSTPEPEQQPNLDAKIKKFGDFEATISWQSKLSRTGEKISTWFSRKRMKFRKWVQGIDWDESGFGGGGNNFINMPKPRGKGCDALVN